MAEHPAVNRTVGSSNLPYGAYSELVKSGYDNGLIFRRAKNTLQVQILYSLQHCNVAQR